MQPPSSKGERSAASRGSQDLRSFASHATTFTILCGTMMIFFTALPSSARWTPSSASTAFSMAAWSALRSIEEIRPFLAVHLHRQSYHIFDDKALVRNRPRRFRNKPGMAEARPALLGQMRHHGRKKPHKNVGRLAEGIAQVGADLGGRDRADGGREFVGKIIDLGDGTVEPQPANILLDLEQGRVRRLADLGRGGRKIRFGFGASGGAARPANSSTSRQARWTNFAAPCTPSSVQITSRSGGESESMNQRAVSAP